MNSTIFNHKAIEKWIYFRTNITEAIEMFKQFVIIWYCSRSFFNDDNRGLNNCFAEGEVEVSSTTTMVMITWHSLVRFCKRMIKWFGVIHKGSLMKSLVFIIWLHNMIFMHKNMILRYTLSFLWVGFEWSHADVGTAHDLSPLSAFGPHFTVHVFPLFADVLYGWSLSKMRIYAHIVDSRMGKSRFKSSL